MTKFSLIVSVYNAQQELVAFLDSLLVQTEKDFEIMIFDNASDDESYSLLKSYAKKDKRIKLKHYINPQASAKIKNTALKDAKGEVVAFLSAASTFDEDFLKLVWRKINSANSDILLANFGFDSVSSVLQGERTLYDTNYFAQYSFAKNSQHIFNLNLPTINNIFYRSSFLQKQKLLFLTDSFGEDFAFYITGLSVAKSVCVLRKSLFTLDVCKIYMHPKDMLTYQSFANTADLLEKMLSQKQFVIGKLSYENALTAYLYLMTQQFSYPLKNFWKNFVAETIVPNFGLDKMDKKSFYVPEYFDWLAASKHYLTGQKTANAYLAGEEKVVPIILIADNDVDAYKTNVLLQSIIANVDAKKFYDVYVLYFNNISSDVQKLFIKNQMRNLTVTFVNVREYNKENKYPVRDDFLLCVGLIPQIFGMYKKVILLRNNVVVLHDISKLMQTDMEDYMIAGVPDCGSDPYVEDKLKLIEEMYVNSSVLILNISECEKQNLMQMLLEKQDDVICRHTKDILNFTIQDSIRILPFVYNSKESLLCGNQVIEDYPYRIENVCILNYDKGHPRQFLLSPFADVWWKYARESSFYEEMFEHKEIPEVRINDSIYKLMKEYIKEAVLYLFTFGKTAARHKKQLMYIWKRMDEELR